MVDVYPFELRQIVLNSQMHIPKKVWSNGNCIHIVPISILIRVFLSRFTSHRNFDFTASKMILIQKKDKQTM